MWAAETLRVSRPPCGERFRAAVRPGSTSRGPRRGPVATSSARGQARGLLLPRAGQFLPASHSPRSRAATSPPDILCPRAPPAPRGPVSALAATSFVPRAGRHEPPAAHLHLIPGAAGAGISLDGGKARFGSHLAPILRGRFEDDVTQIATISLKS